MEVDNSTDKKERTVINIGEALIEARDNLALSTTDIANELNLTISIISKIESNEFSQDIPLAFIRGYVKSYATRVGLDTRSILLEFDHQSGVESPSLKRVQTASKFDFKRKEINSGSYLIKSVSVLLVLLFVFFAGLAIWKKLDLGAAVDSSSVTESLDIDIPLTIELNDSQTNIEVTTNVTSDLESENKPTSDLSDQISAPVIKPKPLEVIQSNNNNQVVLVADKPTAAESFSDNRLSNASLGGIDLVPLELVFSADCWVKITDARNEVLALGVKTLGKNMTLQGVKPIKVILGEPSAVSMTFDGKNYDLSSYSAGRRAVIELN